MANIKFSQFTAEADINNFTGVVGYAGAANTRISPADLASSLLVLSGGISGGPGTIDTLPVFTGAQTLGDSIYVQNAGAAIATINGERLVLGDGTANAVDFLINTTGVAGDTVEIQSQGTQFLFHEKGADMRMGPNDDIVIDDSGSAGISMSSPTTFVSTIIDGVGNTGAIGEALASTGTGVTWVNNYKAIQSFVWTNGAPVAYGNFPPAPGTLPTNSGLPFDPTPLIQTTNLPAGATVANYTWTCANAAGGDAGQVATFTLGANGGGVWRVSTANHWFDQNSFIEVIVEFVINGVGVQVTDERSNDGAGDKIYYGELYQEFSAGDALSVFVTFQNSSTPATTPFPSANGNRPIEVNFERII